MSIAPATQSRWMLTADGLRRPATPFGSGSCSRVLAFCPTSMPSEPSSEEQQDQEWRRLRLANRRRLILYPVLALLCGIAWLLWELANTDPGRG